MADTSFMSAEPVVKLGMSSTAFFDLDRTLLPKASGPIFAHHLTAEGLGSAAANLPGADLMVSMYDLFGETRLSMQLAQLGVRAAKGWPVEAVVRAAKNAVPDLLAAIPDYAKLVLDQHRSDGVKLVIASTSPVVLMQPLADALGFDDVIGTRWRHESGTFTGDTDGPFVWGTEKREAVLEWCGENGVSPGASYAYSDSYFDTPLLEAVGTAIAVNPDARLAIVAGLKGWEIRNFDAPPGVLKFLGRELQEWTRPFRRPELRPMAHWEFSGLENLPKSGPGIVVFNHRSYFDVVAMSLVFAKIDRPARFLGKAEMFDDPIIGPIARSVGGIRVDRGSGSGQPLRSALDALTGGDLVMIAPQGTIPRGRAFFDPELVGRPGAAWLAKESKAPIIPVGLWGTEKVWPRNQKTPTMAPTRLLSSSRPTVSVAVGEPVDVKRRSVDADTRRIMDAISALLPEESRVSTDPTPEQLAKTFPPGHSMDLDEQGAA